MSHSQPLSALAPLEVENQLIFLQFTVITNEPLVFVFSSIHLFLSLWPHPMQFLGFLSELCLSALTLVCRVLLFRPGLAFSWLCRNFSPNFSANNCVYWDSGDSQSAYSPSFCNYTDGIASILLLALQSSDRSILLLIYILQLCLDKTCIREKLTKGF